MTQETDRRRYESSRVATAMLFAVVFVCGFALMALEMLGARLLSPDFGSTIYVWGSVISVFLLALSVGYWLGGRLSTWRANGLVLGGIILLAAVGFAVVPFISRPVNERIFNLDLGDRWGALLSAMVLFLSPSLLLGTVSPYAIRLAASDVAEVGATAGRLYAISTLGSFLGCILTSFYFVLWWSVPSILWIMAGLLAAAAVVCGLIPRRKEM